MNITEQFKEALEPALFELEKGGPVVKLKRVGLMDLILQGRIPDQLSTQTAKLVSQTVNRDMTPGELKKFGGLVDAVCEVALVEPSPEDVPVSDIPWVWKVKIFNWANTPGDTLRPFRPEQN